MAAHATATSTPVPLVRPRVQRPRPRFVVAFVILLVVAIVAAFPEQTAGVAHAACTLGNPEHVTCGESLALLGYP